MRPIFNRSRFDEPFNHVGLAFDPPVNDATLLSAVPQAQSVGNPEVGLIDVLGYIVAGLAHLGRQFDAAVKRWDAYFTGSGSSA